MKILSFLLLFISFSYAQYGNNLITSYVDGSTYVYDILTSTGSNITSAIETTGNYAGAVSNTLNGNGVTLTFFYNKTQNSGGNPQARSTTSTSGRGSVSGTLDIAMSTAGSTVATDFTVPFATNRIEISIGNTVLTNFSAATSVRQKLDTLYISTSGNNTALGKLSTPILTLAEAQTRGFYTGGVFLINAGTFDETFTVNGDVTISGSGSTVTSIDCGSNAVTLNGLDFYITTLTGTNITDNRTFTPTDTGQDKGFKEHSKFKRFKGLK